MTKNNSDYQIGQLVQVEPRLWAGINRPGGVGRISAIGYCGHGYIETVDVKYIVGGGCDTKVDLDFIHAHEELGARKRTTRTFYSGEPAAEVHSPVKNQPAGRKSHPTVSPATKTPAVTPAPADVDPPQDVASRANVTKASTKGRMTLQTGSDIQMMDKRKSTTKPPVKIIRFPSCGTTNVSPLQNPLGLDQVNFAVKKRPAHAAVATNSIIVKKRLAQENAPQPTGQHMQPMVNAAPPAFKKKMSRSPRPLPLSKSRVPLRQVFDNDMGQRETFVNDVVGKIKAPPAAKVVDSSRQELFNKLLGQLFPHSVDSIQFQSLMDYMIQQSFTEDEITDCLRPLEDRFMVADGEVYKI